MTLEYLLRQDAAYLESLSDAELQKLCEPFFNVTRPELCVKPIKTPSRSSREFTNADHTHRAKVMKGLDIARQFGFDLDI